MARKQPLEQDAASPADDEAVAKTRSYGINRFTLLGRMTADPEIRFTQTGKALLRFGLATSVAGIVAFHDCQWPSGTPHLWPTRNPHPWP